MKILRLSLLTLLAALFIVACDKKEKLFKCACISKGGFAPTENYDIHAETREQAEKECEAYTNGGFKDCGLG